MKGKPLFSIIVPIITGLLFTALIFIGSLRILIYNSDIFDYGINNSDYIEVLKREIVSDAQPVLDSYGLNQVLDVDEALSSFDFGSEVTRYMQIRLQGIETEIDNKAFRSFIEKVVLPVLQQRDNLTPEQVNQLLKEIETGLVHAYTTPFLYTPLANFLQQIAHFQKMLMYLFYGVTAIVVIALLGILFSQGKKASQAYYRLFWTTAISSLMLGLLGSVIKYQDQSISFSVFFNTILKTTGFLDLFVAIVLIYLLFIPLAYKLAKTVAIKISKPRKTNLKS